MPRPHALARRNRRHGQSPPPQGAAGRTTHKGGGRGDANLSAYSPDMNPIEKAFSKLKAFLRKIAERTVAGLLRALQTCAEIFKPSESHKLLQIMWLSGQYRMIGFRSSGRGLRAVSRHFCPKAAIKLEMRRPRYETARRGHRERLRWRPLLERFAGGEGDLLSSARVEGSAGNEVRREHSRHGRKALRRGYGGLAQPGVSMQSAMSKIGDAPDIFNLLRHSPSAQRGGSDTVSRATPRDGRQHRRR